MLFLSIKIFIFADMKKIFKLYHSWLDRRLYKKRCRNDYARYCRLFWLYAEKTDSATSAVLETENAMSWFRDLDKEFKDCI